jgi:hypothetical protein
MLEGTLAVELPPHMRAFARAHAESRPSPPAPTLLSLSSTLETVGNACRFDVLLDRGIALLRLVAPIVIESDRRVAAIRAEPPSWAGLQRLARARDAVARTMFGLDAIELLHILHGTDGPAPASIDPIGPAIEGWNAKQPALDTNTISDTWQLVAARLGVTGSVRFDRATRRRGTDGTEREAQPRTFVVEPKREVIVVVSNTIETPAARFAVLHELGHAFLALAMSPGVPRAVDEAAASYVARFMEPPTFLPPRWSSDVAEAARARRLALARTLDRVERALPALEDPPGTVPPWALWHDPGAQAAYVEAEAMADRLRAELGPTPPRGQVLRALIAERDKIDQRTHITTA